MQIQHNKLQKSQEDDKNCQENMNRRPVKSKCVLTRNVKLPNITKKLTKLSNKCYVASEAPNGCVVRETCNEVK